MTSKKLEFSSTVLITGSAKRIGREIAIFLAQKNYNLVIHFHHSKKEAENLQDYLTKNFKIKVDLVKANLFDPIQTKKLADHMINNYDDWNMIINNASIFNCSNFSDQDYENKFAENFNIHVNSPIILINKFYHYIIKKKLKNALVINLLDKNIVRYDTKHFYYLLTKKFLAESTKMIALDIAPEVRINGLAIGYTIAESNDLNAKEFENELIKKIPLKKKCNQQFINNGIEFLINNDLITGQILSIDGGSSLNHAG